MLMELSLVIKLSSLLRLNIQPFVKARTVLEGLLCKDEQAEETTKTEVKGLSDHRMQTPFTPLAKNTALYPMCHRFQTKL